MNAENRIVREPSLGCAKGGFDATALFGHSNASTKTQAFPQSTRRLYCPIVAVRTQECLLDEPPGPARAAAQADVVQGHKTRGVRPTAIFLW